MSVKEASFAARIGPIRRFTGEDPTEFVRKYSSLLSRFMNTSEINGILENDSQYSETHKLLLRALKVANYEIDSESGKKATRENAASVFSRLSLDDDLPDRSMFYHYNMEVLSPQNAYPVKEVREDGKDRLIRGFYMEMDELGKSPPPDFHTFIVCFDRICMQYMWCFSASDYEGEDVSLYDYMKIAEAVMACLVSCNGADSPYVLVMGDFSGIQKYIFSNVSANHGGIAKTLRARSFYVDIISRVFSQCIVDRFDVERSNILLQTGGKFYCMVPAVKNFDEWLVKTRNDFDRYLFQLFHGTVCVNLAWLRCGDKEMETYSDTIVKLNEMLGEKKMTPFSDIIQNEKGWDTESFILLKDKENLSGKHICRTCGTELIDSDKELCDMCEMMMKIGTALPHTKYIVFTKTQDEDTYPIFENYGIRLISSCKRENFRDAYLIEALNFNNTKPDTEGTALPFTRKYMSNFIPMGEHDDPLTFDQIAAEASGENKLAVLKADVDTLGFLFAQGLRTNTRHYGTISRVSTLSRLLEVFFCGVIEKLLEENREYRNVYSVFSGGDDLFLIGPWDVMLNLALTIQKKFKEFSAYNKSVTLSASVTAFDDKEHIAFMAEQSEEQLERAKKGPFPKAFSDKTGRDSACVMGDLLSWEDFEDQMQCEKNLEDLLREGKISTELLRRLAKYSDMYRRYLEYDDTWQLMFEPMFYYDRNRNYQYLQGWFKNYVQSMEHASNSGAVKKNLFFAETVIKIVLKKTRRERN